MGTSERRAVEGDGVREGEVRSVQKSEVERTVCVRGRWRLVMKLLLEWPEYNVCDLGEAKIILPKYFGATSSCDGRRPSCDGPRSDRRRRARTWRNELAPEAIFDNDTR